MYTHVICHNMHAKYHTMHVKCQNIHMMSHVTWLTSETRMACVVLVMTVLMLLWAGPAVSFTQGLLVLCTQGKGVNIHLYQDVNNVNILLVNVKHDNVNQEMVLVCKTDRTKRLNHPSEIYFAGFRYFYPTWSKNTFNCLCLFIFRIIVIVPNIQEIICLNCKLADLLIFHYWGSSFLCQGFVSHKRSKIFKNDVTHNKIFIFCPDQEWAHIVTCL